MGEWRSGGWALVAQLLAATQLDAHRDQLPKPVRRRVATRLAGWLRDQTADGMRSEAWQTALVYRDDLHAGSARELATAARTLLGNSDPAYRVRGVQYASELAGKVAKPVAVELTTDISAILDKDGVNAKDAYGVMESLLPREQWDRAAKENLRDKLTYLSENASDPAVREWAQIVLSEEEQSRDPSDQDGRAHPAG